MSTSQLTVCVRELQRLLDPEELIRLARECGLTKRLRVCRPENLLWTFIAGMSSRKTDTLADLQRVFIAQTGKSVEYKAFYERIAHEMFPEFLRLVLERAMNMLALRSLRARRGSLRKFKDILAHDGSSFAVQDALEAVFPGRFTKVSPAAVEMHCTYSLLDGQPTAVTIAPDREAERPFLPDPAELSGMLLLIDRGYVSREYFAELEQHGASFVCRAKSNLNPKILRVHEGLSERAIGRHFKDVRLPKRTVDFQAEFGTGKNRFVGRVVAFYVKKKRKHVLLITNLPADEAPADEIAEIYRLRWQEELFFKEIKSFTNLRKFQTANPAIAEALIWATMLTVMLRRHLAFRACAAIPDQMAAPFRVAAAGWLFMTEIAREALQGTAGTFRRAVARALEYIVQVGRRSNPNRDDSFKRLELEPCNVGA